MSAPETIEKYDEVKRQTVRMHLTEDYKVKRIEFVLDDPVCLIDFNLMRVVAPAPPNISRGTPQGARTQPRPCGGCGDKK